MLQTLQVLLRPSFIPTGSYGAPLVSMRAREQTVWREGSQPEPRTTFL